MPEAVWFPAPRQVEIRQEEAQEVGADDVRVQALVSGLSAGSEMLVYRGQAPTDLRPDLPTLATDFRFPIKYGYASVGRLVEVGERVGQPEVGDVVFVLHPHQTEYVVPATAAVRLPSGVAPDLGVFTANLETAVTAVLDAHPRLSEAVLVVGQGVVGLLITMLLREAGGRPVITADPIPRRRDAALEAGAGVAVAPDEIEAAVREATGGRGVDVAIEASGNPAALQPCIDSVAFGGTVVVVSWYGTKPVQLQLGGAFHRKRVRVVSSQVSTLEPSLGGRWDRERRTSVVGDLLRRLPLAPLVTHRIPFRDAAAAYELLDNRPEECLQVVLTYV